MMKRTELPKAAAPAHREECYVCRRAKKNCLCGGAKPFATKTRFIILMHTKEAHKQRTGTARLAKMCLTNAELIIGTDFTSHEHVNALIQDPAYSPFVLYPGPQAVSFGSLAEEFRRGEKIPLVFVIDGTWRGAQRVLRKSRNVSALPRLSFSGSYASQFKIKKQPRPHCVSTIEAVYYLCKEAQAAGYEDLKGQEENLMAMFRELVDTQLSYQRGKGRRREENKTCSGE
jgi:DTW domain-containing protein YfiP